MAPKELTDKVDRAFKELDDLKDPLLKECMRFLNSIYTGVKEAVKTQVTGEPTDVIKLPYDNTRRRYVHLKPSKQTPRYASASGD